MIPKIEFFYQQLTEDQKQEVVDFWVAQKALNETQAKQRVDELVLIARGDENQIIAVKQ